MYQPRHIADWFLGRINREAGDSITHLKLQKLLYYAQAWALVLLDRPLFREDFQAWVHGPVLDSVYRTFQARGFEALPAPPSRPELEDVIESLLEDVYRIYGEHSALALEQQTHREDPWREARGGMPPDVRSNKLIRKDSMMRFYGAMYANAGGPVIAATPSGFRLGNPSFAGPDGSALPPPDDDDFPPEDHGEFDRALMFGLRSLGEKRARRRQHTT